MAQGFSEPRRPKATAQSLRSYFFTNSLTFEERFGLMVDREWGSGRSGMRAN
ncbi:MAG: IstB-like ATP-binding domain-containing protein [Myxococcales bacterium]|nr:IstB-like ATP-binding domain-containing protein [Myxococcales bacterium]